MNLNHMSLIQNLVQFLIDSRAEFYAVFSDTFLICISVTSTNTDIF